MRMTGMRAAATIAALMVCLGGSACAMGQDEGAMRTVGYIAPGPKPLTSPDTVSAGVAFTVTVTTFGSPCTSADGARVTVQAATADVTPYDRVEGGACAATAIPLPRDVVLAFATAGPATIQLHGRDGGGGTVTVSRPVTVVAP